MKVTDVTSYIIDSGASKNWIFVKIHTNEGIYGWGEAYTQVDRDESILAHVSIMGEYLKGRDPFAIKHFTKSMYQDYILKRPSMEYYCALSGIEQALWDIIGKKVNEPVYNLIGGPCRGKIRVYANGWYAGASSPEEFARLAKETVNRGFTALKFDPFPGPWRELLSKEEEECAIETVKTVRESVGNDIDLLLEVHRRLEPHTAIRVAEKMAEFNLFWYEEPVDVGNITNLVEVRQNIKQPVVTGETLYSKTHFNDVFKQNAADIINPDVSSSGILELKEIASMAESNNVYVSPHNYNSTTIALGATLQVAACIPNFLITEYFVHFESRGKEIAKSPFEVKDGYIDLPKKPGLGIELDEDVLFQTPKRPFQLREIRHYTQETDNTLVSHNTDYLK